MNNNGMMLGNIPKSMINEQVYKAFSKNIQHRGSSNGIKNVILKYPDTEFMIANTIISDDGNIEVSFNIYNNNSLSTHNAAVINFTPHNTESMHRLAVISPGINGWNEAQKEAIDKEFIGNNYTLLKLNDCSNPPETYSAIPTIMENLTDVFSKEEKPNYDYNYVFLGQDASVVKTIDCAEAVVSHSEYDKPIDFMLSNAINGGSDFVERLNNSKKLKETLVSTGSIIYTYENEESPNFRNIINNYGTLADEGMIVIGVRTPKEQKRIGEVPEGNINVASKTGAMQGEEYYLITPKPSIVLGKWDYYDSSVQITEKQLNNYLEYRDSKGEQAKKAYINDITTYILTGEDREEGAFISLAGGEYSLNNDEILVKFDVITEKANSVLNRIRNTSFNDSTIDYQFSQDSTTDFPESLNMGNVLLYNISNKLMDNVVGDIHNVNQMLKNYLYLDREFTTMAENIMDDMYRNGNVYEDISTNIISIPSNKTNYGIFARTNTAGNTGRISMIDIDNILKGSTLTGTIGNGLKNEYEDAAKLQNEINELIGLSKNTISGMAWEAEKIRLAKLSDMCGLRMNATKTLEEAYIKALKLVRDYLGNDEYLDDSVLEELKVKLAKLKSYHLPKANEELDEEIKKRNIARYNLAQKEIPILEAKIAKIDGLAKVLNDANKIVRDAIDKMNSEYGSVVNNYKEVYVSDVTTIM